MNKFLITLATLVAFALSGVAYAETKISGLHQHFVGAGDDADGGITHQFTRFSFATDTTLDNGWTAGGAFTIQVAATAGSFALPSSNSMYIATDNVTVNIGATADAVTSLIPRVAAMVPGGGTDAGYQFAFAGGLLGTHSVQFSEAYYAWNSHRIDIDLPSVNGFTVGASFTPALDMNNADASSRAQPEISDNHGETTHVAVSYSGEMEGMSYTVGVGSINGNAQGTSKGSANQLTNNDLAAVTGAIKVTMGNLTLGAHAYDNGDSFGAAGDADKASDQGYNLAATYAMGNITVGVGYAHQEMVRGTRAQAAAATLTSAAANNVREDTTTMIGIGYNLGGGVSSWVQLSSNEHSDGDHATTEADPQVIFAGITLGF